MYCTPGSSGGLGTNRATSTVMSIVAHSGDDQAQDHACKAVLSSYDLLRLGYVIVDDEYLVSIHNWLLLVLAMHVRRRTQLQLRVLLFRVVVHCAATSTAKGGVVVEKKPTLCTISDPCLATLRSWQLSTRALQ